MYLQMRFLDGKKSVGTDDDASIQDFEGRKGVFANVDFRVQLDDDMQSWWRRTKSTWLSEVALHVAAMCPTNQAAEHGWAHLCRVTTPVRNRLSMDTRSMLATVQHHAHHVHPYVQNQAPAQSQKKRKSWVPPSLRFDVKLTIEDCRRHAGADGAELGPGKLQSPLEADDVDSMDSHSSSSTSEEDSSDESQGSEGDVPPCVPCDPFVQVSEDDLEHNLRSEM